MYFAHISDLHIGDPTKPGEDNLQKIISEINHFCAPLACVLVTGDIVHGDSPKHYKKAFEILNELKVPYYVIPGNKDGTENLIESLREFYPQHPLPQTCDGLQYVADDYPVRLIAVDTYKEGKMNGELTDERLQWLREKLADNPEKKPVAVMVHQFPFESGLRSFDAAGENWYTKFRYAIEDYKDTVKLVACGHLHNPVVGNISGVPVITAPSSNWRAKYDFTPVENIVAEVKPLGFYVHRWEGGQMTSSLIPTIG